MTEHKSVECSRFNRNESNVCAVMALQGDSFSVGWQGHHAYAPAWHHQLCVHPCAANVVPIARLFSASVLYCKLWRAFKSNVADLIPLPADL
jgi:hypothetical protein